MHKEKKCKIPNGTTALTICEIELIAKAPCRKGYPILPTGYGDYMRQARLNLGLTQFDLSLIFKVYTSTIDKWERGITKPNLYNKNKIIEFLGYDPIPKLNINF